jgi:hypothetical protein
MLVGCISALDRVENVVYLFDRSYGVNRPDKVINVHKECALTSNNRDKNFGVFIHRYSSLHPKPKVLRRILEIQRPSDSLTHYGPVKPIESDLPPGFSMANDPPLEANRKLAPIVLKTRRQENC